MLLSTRRNYKVAVYFRDADGIWQHMDTWTGKAADAADAKEQALEALSDPRIESWKSEILVTDKHRSHCP